MVKLVFIRRTFSSSWNVRAGFHQIVHRRSQTGKQTCSIVLYIYTHNLSMPRKKENKLKEHRKFTTTLSETDLAS